MKKITSLFMAALLAIGISGTAFGAELPTEGTDFTGKTVILHTNDSHSRVDDNMGFAGVSALKKAYEQTGATVLLLDAGDTLHGLPFATVEEGASIITLMNTIGYDAMTPGNHDFNYGTARLLELVDMAQFSILSANAIKDGKTILPANTVIEKDGIRYGIFGLSTPETATATNPKNIEGITFENPVTAAEKEIEALEAQDVDFIIAVAHLGTSEASEFTSKRVAEETEGIDIIIDGHSHTVLEQGLAVKDTLIASTGEYINNTGVIVIDNETGEKEAFLANATTFPVKDDAITAAIEAVKAEQETLLAEVVAHTTVDLDGARATVRTKESNFGNLVCDAFLAETNADIAILNGGTIRDSIAAGDITEKDLITVFPFGNYVVTKELSGADVLAALEEGFAGYPEEAGAFPQIGGMKVQFDPSKEAGQRVVSVEIDGTALDPAANYVVAVNDFVASGGDYTVIAPCKTVGEYSSMVEIIVDYMKNTDLSAYAAPDGRLTMIDAAAQTATTEAAVLTPAESITEETTAEETPLTRGEVVTLLLEKSGDAALQKEDILKGYGTKDTDLKESQPVTEAECIVMIQRAFSALPTEDVAVDVPVPDWAKEAATYLVQAGVLTESIDANDTMTKTELNAILDNIAA